MTTTLFDSAHFAPPLCKWAGSKRALVPELRRFLPSRMTGRYFEPFVGAGALFFSVRPANAVLADVNPDLVATYRAVRDSVSALVRLLSSYPRDPDFYIAMRASSTKGWSDIKVGARFLYLVRCGFNGLWRVNSKGQHNVPFGDNKGPVCDESTLRLCSTALRGVSIENLDFEKLLDRAVAGDVAYLDPPYIPLSETSSFTGYALKGFTFDDQVRLRDSAVAAKKRGVHVVLSNSSAPAVRRLYAKHFTLHPVSVRRAINSKTDARGAVKEVIIL